MADVVKTDGGVVVLQYADLAAGADLGPAIEAAYGFDGLGLLVVAGIPGFVEKRKALLPLAHQFAREAPDDIKARVEDKASGYSFGWSHGKEALAKGKFDAYKGSYYNNPQYDTPFPEGDERREKYKDTCSPNIWPTGMKSVAADGTEAPAPAVVNQVEGAFKDLGQIDRFVTAKLGVDTISVAKAIEESRTSKGRLLYYFPVPDTDTTTVRDHESWCGWHNDHGSLTSLCPAMFVREGGEGVGEGAPEYEVASPDPAAGLYIRPRNKNASNVVVERSEADGDTTEMRISMPKDVLAFQIGESSQIMCGGVLRATPHAVQCPQRGLGADALGRATFAVFMQPNADVKFEIPAGRTFEETACGQFEKGQTFAEFSKATIAYYYGSTPTETPSKKA